MGGMALPIMSSIPTTLKCLLLTNRPAKILDRKQHSGYSVTVFNYTELYRDVLHKSWLLGCVRVWFGSVPAGTNLCSY